MKLRRVAVLCAAVNSVYHQFRAVDIYDKERDAFSFAGGMPVIAHPPCRSWSRLKRFVTAPDDVIKRERELAFFCVEQVRRFGGVLEHPAYSDLWAAAKLPGPSEQPRGNGEFCFAFHQFWFGHKSPKPTWLFIAGIKPKSLPAVPLRLRGETYCWNNLSSKQRSATPQPFAKWLIATARGTSIEVAQ